MKYEERRTFTRAIEKMKEAGQTEIFFYTIPGGFKNNTELLEYWTERGYQAEIIDTSPRHGILHVWW